MRLLIYNLNKYTKAIIIKEAPPTKVEILPIISFIFLPIIKPKYVKIKADIEKIIDPNK